MVQRSYGVVDALIGAVDSYNIHAAAPLLRLQLDTLFRAHYAAIGPDSDDLAMKLLTAEEFRKMKDAEGRKISDGRLKDLAAAAYPWAPAAYGKTSGWVYFSLSHIFATVQVSGMCDLFMEVPARPRHPAVAMAPRLRASIRATKEFFLYVRSWAARKGMPSGELRHLHG